MPAAAHRVRLQRWRVAARSAGEAFTLRTRLKAAVEDELLPVFGLAFDEAAPEDALLHIPRLELRLRVPSLDALAGALGEALGEALRRELRVRPPPPPRAAAAERLSVLLGYLDSGTLAWHAAHLDIATITPELRAALLANLSPIVHRARRETASFER
ncbi:MAG: contractile injection system tape measure protein, partial [Betaproteobacteria bacterium]|nr:contractile injection system tape measure protein [Betaproteobacteria bacterium]